jgi:hypothetical protein
LQLRDAVEISFFGHRFDVPPDGQCGFYSLLIATIISIQSEGGSDPTLERWNKQGFAGASFFRKSLRSFLSIKPPTRIVKEVTEFINSIMKDKQQLKAIPTMKDTKAACLKLRDDELEREVRQGGESVPEVVKDRVLIGRDTPAKQSCAEMDI